MTCAGLIRLCAPHLSHPVGVAAAVVDARHLAEDPGRGAARAAELQSLLESFDDDSAEAALMLATELLRDVWDSFCGYMSP